MRTETRLAYNKLAAQIATINSVPSAEQKFTVTPSVQQKLETRIQESSEFLGKINIVLVTEQKGEKIGLGIGKPVAGTQDTTAGDRVPRDPTDLTAQGYECKQTNFDTAIPYTKLDMWAKFPDFQPKFRDVIIKQQGLDRITIGFNGTSRAATSDPVANPLLQDVNKGWLQKYREDAPARVMTEGATAGTIKVGTGAGTDYKNLDALVFDAVTELVDPWHRERTDLVAIVGRELLSDKYFPMINKDQAPSETLAADIIISQKRLGGLPAVRVPNFPAGKIFITTLENLSIYVQEGARRRQLVDNAKRDRVENYESSNEDYVVEDYGCGCLIENIAIIEA